MEIGMSVRILIVDDHAIIREGIRSVLRDRPEWEICGEAADGREAVRLAKELNPDAIILDVTMPIMGGLGAAHEISRSNPSCRLLIFTMHSSRTLDKFVRQAGAHGLVAKSEAKRNLVAALEQLLAGETFFTGDGELETENVN